MPWYTQATGNLQNLQLSSLVASRSFDKLRSEFSSVTGLAVEFRDRTGVPFNSRRSQHSYCELVRSTEAGVRNCWLSAANALPASPGDITVFSCHACDHVITPLVVDNQIEGTIVLGPLRLHRSQKFQHDLLSKELSIPADSIAREAEKIPYIPKRKAIMALRFFASASNGLISQMTISRDNTVLQTKYRQTVRELSSLQAVTDSTLSSLDLNEILHTLLHRFIQALHAQAGAILLVDDRAENLSTYATVGIPLGPLRPLSFNVGTGFVGSVASSRQIQTYLDIGTDATGFSKYLADAGVKSVLGAPLVSRDKVVGVIVIGTIARHRFQARDSALMEILSQRASIPVENARLYDLERERVKKLEELDQLRTEFISTVSHEFRTPMAIIKGFAQLLLRREPWKMEKDLVRDYLTKIDKGISHLTGLVDELLTLSQFEEGKTSPRFALEAVSVMRILAEVFETLKLEAETRQIKLEASIDVENDLVHSDGAAFREILFNIVDNAIKYSNDGGIVSVTTSGIPNEIIITIQDRGVGVNEEELPYLFEKFRRLNNSRSIEAGGVGLGLFITKRLVEALAGRIWVESREGEGSTFNFTQPRHISTPISQGKGY